MMSSIWMLTLAALPLGCQEQEKPAKPTEMGWTGVLSEEEFKKLHELTQEKAPPLRGAMVELPTGERAYLSLPKEPVGPKAGIVVIHEWWGLNEHIEHWADRLAGLGYAALAVDLYGGKVAATSDEAMALVRSVDEAKAMKTLLAAHEMLQRDSRIAAKKTACIGWCFGGGWSLKLALAAKDLDAAVIYYGRLVTDPAELKEIHAKILGIFGNMDNGIPPRVVDEFDKALAEAGVEHEIHRYDANHAFANPSSARYDQKAAADAWVQVQAFLKRAL